MWKDSEEDIWKRNINWYEGCSIFCPSTNNALERFNRTIKERYMAWKKSNIIEFIGLAAEILADVAKIKEPSLESKNYDEFSLRDGDMLDLVYPVDSHDGISRFIVTSGNTDACGLETLKEGLIKGSFDSFDSFRGFYSNISILTVLSPLKSWLDVFCSCMRCLHLSRGKNF